MSYGLLIFIKSCPFLLSRFLLRNDTILYGKAKESKNLGYFDKELISTSSMLFLNMLILNFQTTENLFYRQVYHPLLSPASQDNSMS